MNKKKIIYLLLLIILFLPLIQMNALIFEIIPLNASFTLNKKPDSLIQNWFSEGFQKQYDKYFNENFGFRNTFVKLNNQIGYSLFNIANYNKAVIGKDGYLFDIRYITSIYGKDFIGVDNIEDKVLTIKLLQDTLSQLGTSLVVVFTPNKARFYYDKIPNYLKQQKTYDNNFNYYLHFIDKYGVNYIDFNEYFLQIKDTCSYPIIPKQGIHWSMYGASIACDSIIKYINKTKEFYVSNYKLVDFELSDSLRDSDYDIGDAMNLFFEMKHPQMAYPVFEFKQLSNNCKPTILTIADSYHFMIYKSDLYKNCFNENSEFWYYFKKIYPENINKKIDTLIDIDELLNYDIIILMATEFNLSRFAFGFINGFKNNKASKYIKEISSVIERIKDNDDWYTKVKQQAKERKIAEEEMLIISAKYTINNRKSKENFINYD